MPPVLLKAWLYGSSTTPSDKVLGLKAIAPDVPPPVLPPPETVENLIRYDSRKYGHTVISFYRVT